MSEFEVVQREISVDQALTLLDGTSKPKVYLFCADLTEDGQGAYTEVSAQGTLNVFRHFHSRGSRINRKFVFDPKLNTLFVRPR